MPYRLFIPPGYDKSKPYPLVLWLHGAGGAGTNNRAQISQDQIPGTHTWTKPQNQAKFPTFVLVPQSPTNWISDGVESLSPEMLLVLEILEAVRAEFNIDRTRIYVAGQSDGGVGTWNVITQRPDVFAGNSLVWRRRSVTSLPAREDADLGFSWSPRSNNSCRRITKNDRCNPKGGGTSPLHRIP